jgi:hypothetical protein
MTGINVSQSESKDLNTGVGIGEELTTLWQLPPMLIKTNVDISGALALTDLILKKVPYATNNALTRTAKELVEVERNDLKTEFQIRKQFILNRVQITKYSRPDSLWTIVAINKKVQGGELLLTMFEEGGEKRPELGSELAVPLTGGAARPSFAQTVRPSLLYKALNLQKHTTALGKIQYKGDRRTFVIQGVGIFQRGSSKKRSARVKSGQSSGRDESGATLIYSFKRGVPLRAQMHFVRTARELVQSRFSDVWREEFVKEMVGRARRK